MGLKRLYLDSCVIIYSVEADAYLRDQIIAAVKEVAANEGQLITSRLSTLECRVAPLRKGDLPLLAQYDAFFASAALTMVELDRSVLDLATDLRSRTQLHTPDALHVATAMLSQCEAILTGDLRLGRSGVFPVRIVSPANA